LVKRYLTTKQASDYLQEKGFSLKPITLAQYRSKGRGPSYVKFGRKVKYDRRVLDKWCKARFRVVTMD